MGAEPKVVRVRLPSREVVDLPVVRWVDYPGRALVYLGDERQPLLVEREPQSDVFRAALSSTRPSRLPPLRVLLRATVANGMWKQTAAVGAAVLALAVLAHSFVAAPVTEKERAVLPPRPPVSAPARIEPAPTDPVLEDVALPSPTKPPIFPPVVTVRPHEEVNRAKPAPPKAVVPPEPAPPEASQPETVVTAAPQPMPVVVQEALKVAETRAPEPATYRCECGRTFASEKARQRHRKRTVYACIRYPKCPFTSDTPEGVRAHYEAQRETQGRCYSEAIRFMNQYKVVVRPECERLAADPDRRKTMKVRG